MSFEGGEFNADFMATPHTTHSKAFHQHCVTCKKALKDGQEMWQCDACKEKILKQEKPQWEDAEFSDIHGRSNVGEDDWNQGAY